MSIRRKISSPQSLFVFEAAARTLSFTAAGRELNVTQPAVSKTIAALEEHLQCSLFYRERSGLSLSYAGQQLYTSVRLSFDTLENTLDQISGSNNNPGALRLSISSAFASHWLLPQLKELMSDFPEVSLSFQLDIGEMRGPVAPSDLGMRHEREITAGDIGTPFAPEWIIAVASPDYLERNGSLDAPTEGANHFLVKLDNARVTWTRFLHETGQAGLQKLPEIRVPDYAIVLQSALNGNGVALGFASTCSHLIETGALRPALPVSWNTGLNYCLVRPSKSRPSDSVENLIDWITRRNQQQLGRIAERIRTVHAPLDP